MRRGVAYTLSFALHVLAVAAPAGLFQAARTGAAASTPATITVVHVPSPPDQAHEEPVAPPRHEAPGVHGHPHLEVGGFTFDIDKIARRRELLFPFITGDLAFELMTRSLAVIRHAPLGNPYARTAPAAPPLRMTADAIQRVVDESWSRRDRWDRFADIADLLRDYDGNVGDVPLVLRSYLTQNILQPYWNASIPDPRMWVMLGLAAEHVDFIDLIATYVHEHPSTRASTELLFLLDKLIQGSRDTLVTLLGLDPQADAAFTRQASAEAFDLLVSIRDRYGRLLAARGLTTAEDIRHRYDAVRLNLLRSILATTPDGYLADDARFLAGEIQWRSGHQDAALKWWRGLQPSPDDLHRMAIARLVPLLSAARDGRGQPAVDTRAITAALDAEDGRWLMTSYDRLRHFGYRLDTY
jgi:hypothetical protein